MKKKFKVLNKKIVNCKKCKRLLNFRKKIIKNKKKKFINETYWGKPITGFGDILGKILIVGLAPAAHGGQEPEECSLVIDLQTFFTGVFIKLIFQIKKFRPYK